MKSNVKNKINAAESVGKQDLIHEVQSNHQEKYDQMLVGGEPESNNLFYIRYHARFVNYKPTRVKFILDENVAYTFGAQYEGGSSSHGSVAQVDASFINRIRSGETNIATDEIKAPSSPGVSDQVEGMSLLKNGFQDWMKKNGDANAFGYPVGKSSMFSRMFDSKSSGSSEYEALKKQYFSEMTVNFSGNEPSTSQPLYFIPHLTSSKDCAPCKGNGKSQCPTCSGSGKISCPGKVTTNPNGGPMGNRHLACKNGRIMCEGCEGKGCKQCGLSGKVTCPTCSGEGKCTCSRKYNSKYGIGKLYDAAAGTEFCEGSGVIECAECKGHGRIGEMVYVELEPANIDAEYLMFEREQIPNIEKDPTIMYKYLDKSGLILNETYVNNNGSKSEDYDSFSAEVCRKIEEASGLSKSDYPKLFLEAVYYDVVPAKTLEYNHILTATNHKMSFVGLPESKEILFHSNPTAVKHFSFGNLFKIYKSKWAEAFITKSYKDKRDKNNEIRLLIYVAKADGEIEEEEKIVLANSITGLNEFTALEKSKLFKLMSQKELPQLENADFVISTRERADLLMSRLRDMSLEDREEEREEVKMVKEFSQKLDENLGKYNGRLKQFFITWQVSLSVLLYVLMAAFGIFYFTYLKPRKDAKELHEVNIKKEKLLTDFITWTAEDTVNNVDFNSYLLEKTDLTEEGTNDHYNSSLDYLKTIKHGSALLIEGEKLSYKAYWDGHFKQLKPRLDSLNVLLNMRKERLQSENSSADSDSEVDDTKLPSIYDLDPVDLVMNLEVSDADGEYFIDGYQYIVEDHEIVDIIAMEGQSDMPDGYEESEEELSPEYQ